MPKTSPHQAAQIFVNGKKAGQDRVLEASFSEENVFAFESLRSYGGVIFRLEEHLDRLFETAKTVGLELTKTREELAKELRNSIDQAGVGDSFLRLMVDGQDSFIFLLERKRPDVIYKQGVDLKTAVTRRHFPKAESPEAKANAFLNNVFARFIKGVMH